MQDHIRHGDVLIVKIDKLPSGLKARQSKVLVEGEATGHAHRLVGDARVFEDAEGNLFFETEAPTEVTHEEHGALDIEPGSYEVRQQREHDHYEGVRKVVD